MWNKLVRLKEWMPISEIPFSYQPFEENVFRFEETKYFLVTPYNSLSLEFAPGGPFLSALVWACSDGAALRAVLQRSEEDDGAVLAPPAELLPRRDAVTHGEILAGLRSSEAKGVLECGDYRMTDGKFVQREIMSNVADYYFRNRHDDESEIPYAIMWKLTKH